MMTRANIVVTDSKPEPEATVDYWGTHICVPLSGYVDTDAIRVFHPPVRDTAPVVFGPYHTVPDSQWPKTTPQQ